MKSGTPRDDGMAGIRILKPHGTPPGPGTGPARAGQEVPPADNTGRAGGNTNQITAVQNEAAAEAPPGSTKSSVTDPDGSTRMLYSTFCRNQESVYQTIEVMLGDLEARLGFHRLQDLLDTVRDALARQVDFGEISAGLDDEVKAAMPEVLHLLQLEVFTVM